MKVLRRILLSVFLASRNVHAWTTPTTNQPKSIKKDLEIFREPSIPTKMFDWSDLSNAVEAPTIMEQEEWDTTTTSPDHIRTLFLAAVALSCTPGMAEASSGDVLPSAFAAYGHYLSIIVMTAAIMAERLTVKPNMSIEEEKFLGYSDITVGVAGVAVLVSGYFRATQYGKGWEFYSHEPIFWLKMAFLGIFGGLSLFPTILIIQRTIKIQQEGSIQPMSEELATRMKKVLNAELTAIAFIPLTATLMSRGVAYINDFPTQIVGPIFFALITGGAVYKYVKDAITWKEPSV